jgi:hypothetical protein
MVATPRIPQRPARELAREKNSQNKEYMEERRESVARFLCTFYMEARKLHLSFDKVVNNPLGLCNFTPPALQSRIVIPPTASTT